MVCAELLGWGLRLAWVWGLEFGVWGIECFEAIFMVLVVVITTAMVDEVVLLVVVMTSALLSLLLWLQQWQWYGQQWGCC